jgi:signal transduction histidine kinase
MKRRQSRRIFGLIGPYPYNPFLIFSFFSACYFSRFIPVIIKQPHGLPRYSTALLMLLLATVPSLSFAVTAFIIQKYRRWSSTNLLYYIAEVALGQSTLFIFAPIIRKFLLKHYDFEYAAALTLTVGFYFGSLVIILISLALLHRAELSVLVRLEKADRLALQLQKDREQLILADENLRKQTSQFLHDRVQSDLMVVSMTLKSVQGDLPASQSKTIENAIVRLEGIRRSDLRNLVQVLTPNIRDTGFNESLHYFVELYSNSLDIDLDISPKIKDLKESQQLGLFRIIEQSLLNSLVHGATGRVIVSISVIQSGEVTLQISDSGPGVDLKETHSGVGTSVIDSWVSILGGTKELKSEPGAGYLISVKFKS